MVSTQRPLHISEGLAQPPHTPSRHPGAAAQTVPQAPQFAGSPPVSTHWLPHMVVSPLHETTQTPASQDWPPAQRSVAAAAVSGAAGGVRALAAAEALVGSAAALPRRGLPAPAGQPASAAVPPVGLGVDAGGATHDGAGRRRPRSSASCTAARRRTPCRRPCSWPDWL